LIEKGFLIEKGLEMNSGYLESRTGFEGKKRRCLCNTPISRLKNFIK